MNYIVAFTDAVNGHMMNQMIQIWNILMNTMQANLHT